ncbi:hypothetical protein [Streptomyces sp. NPDC051016]|uniref:hypothetical protein n=1 Tax=Streptomyces sp. NPDC051016 TaxID=3365638 RepID=UPI00379AAF88
MDEPELHVRDLTPPRYVPACESGRHPIHPFLECDEIDVLAAAFNEMIEGAFAEAFAAVEAGVDGFVMSALHQAVEATVNGSRSGDVIGFRAVDPAEPTPVERALAILDPHLRACPLYDAGPPAIYPHTWKA